MTYFDIRILRALADLSCAADGQYKTSVTVTLDEQTRCLFQRHGVEPIYG